MTERGSLVSRLGYADDARLVILSCDDLGSCHGATVGVYQAMSEGSATCASIMMPAPWAHFASEMYAGDDIGVHLTLNAEHPSYRWGPLTHAPHLTSITLRPEFFDVYLELAYEFKLPIRLPSTISAKAAGFPFRQLAADEGIVFPDHFDHDWRTGSRERVFGAIASLQPGVTEIHVQPAIDTPEVRALGEVAEGWIDDLALATSAELRDALQASGAVLIGYRELRDAMRAK